MRRELHAIFCAFTILGFSSCGENAKPISRVPLVFSEPRFSSLDLKLKSLKLNQRQDCDKNTICVSLGFNRSLDSLGVLTQEHLAKILGIELKRAVHDTLYLNHNLIIEHPNIDLGDDTVIYTQGHTLKVAAKYFRAGKIISQSSQHQKSGDVLIIAKSIELNTIYTHAKQQKCLKRGPQLPAQLISLSSVRIAFRAYQSPYRFKWLNILGQCSDPLELKYRLKKDRGDFIGTYQPKTTGDCTVSFQVNWERFKQYVPQYSGKVNVHAASGGNVRIVSQGIGVKDIKVQSMGSAAAGYCPGFPILGSKRPKLFAQIKVPTQIQVVPNHKIKNARLITRHIWSLSQILALEDELSEVKVIKREILLRPLEVMNIDAVQSDLVGLGRHYLRSGKDGFVKVRILGSEEWHNQLPKVLKEEGMIYP